MIGSHNTMTYLRPKSWWMWVFLPMARCQSKTWQEQAESGAEAFDLRIFWGPDGRLEFRHGLVSFEPESLDSLLSYAQRTEAPVRVLFEERNWWFLKSRTRKLGLIDRFKEFCARLVSEYPGVKLYGGHNTETGERLFDFGWAPKGEVGLYSSNTGLFGDTGWRRVIDDLWPWLYAHLKNRENMEKATDPGTIYSFDFL